MGRLRTVLAVAEGVWNVVWTAFHEQWEAFLDVIMYLLNIFRWGSLAIKVPTGKRHSPTRHIYPGVLAFTAEAAGSIRRPSRPRGVC